MISNKFRNRYKRKIRIRRCKFDTNKPSSEYNKYNSFSDLAEHIYETLGE